MGPLKYKLMIKLTESQYVFNNYILSHTQHICGKHLNDAAAKQYSTHKRSSI